MILTYSCTEDHISDIRRQVKDLIEENNITDINKVNVTISSYVVGYNSRHVAIIMIEI